MKALRTLSDWLEGWLLWILVTGTSWSVGLVIAVVIASGASLALPSQISLLLSGMVVGALIGLVQWEILRPDARGVGAWTLATVIGWIGGLIVTESVFGYPGLGRLLVYGIQRRDLPLIQATTMVIVTIFSLSNLAADILYGILNPRIRLSG